MMIENCRPDLRVRNVEDSNLGIGTIVEVRKNWVKDPPSTGVRVMWQECSRHGFSIWHPARVLEEVT